MEEANGPSTCLVVAAGCSASQGDGDGLGICLGDGQTEAPGVRWKVEAAFILRTSVFYVL